MIAVSGAAAEDFGAIHLRSERGELRLAAVTLDPHEACRTAVGGGRA